MAISLDISNELCVYRYGSGIKLMRPGKINKNYPTTFIRDTGHTVKSFFQLPFCIGFVANDYSVRAINEESAASLSFCSPKAAEGKSIYAVASLSSAQTVVNHYNEVFKQNKMKIHEENIFLKNEKELHRILIHLPIYNDENKLAGLTGLTILVGRHSLADSLNQATQLGFLNSSETMHYLTGKKIEDVYLSKRETECLTFFVYGKSARNIGLILGLSKRTVEAYLQNIKVKLNVSSKSELIEKVIHNLSMLSNNERKY